ncbi:MAG TPA: GNAT family N-acetyltransferase, partial [Pirellulales bacterium]|nr:GNAT family N-acetyltransferase [Pirellulales bacterium]
MATAVDFEPFLSPPLTAGPVRFQTIRDAGELADWRPAWQSLDDAVATPMETFDWIEAAVATFGNDGDVEVIVAHRDGLAVAAAPLIGLPGALGRRWHGLNYHRIYEPAGLASSSPEALAALTEELIGRGRPIFFERVFADAPTRAALEIATQRRGWTRIGPQAATPWIPLDANWATPEDNISSRRRSDLRRARKHAEQRGSVTTQSHVPGESEVDRLLDLAFDVERRSWKGEAGTALALDRSGDFYRRYARAASRQGKLRIEFLHIADQTAAMQIGVVHQQRYWVLKVGYDPQFQRASPGILLMVEAIKQSVAEGLDAYELLGTVEAWIQVWTPHEHHCVSWRFYPRGVRGMIALGADLAHKASKRVQGSGFRVQHFFRPRSTSKPGAGTLTPESRPLTPVLRRAASACLLPLARRAARAYIAGPELTDALRLAAELADKSFASTLGFWDGPEDSLRSVADHYLAALDALAAAGRGDYLSIKLPALQNSRLLLGEVLDRARQLGVRIHFDS